MPIIKQKIVYFIAKYFTCPSLSVLFEYLYTNTDTGAYPGLQLT